MDHIPAVVIGAGVVGLACARELARRGVETLILEREGAIGIGISARNSEVIHAGLYYPTSSLKAELCVKGNPLLYRYCESHGVDFRRCGKLVVATSAADETRLEDLRGQGEANGVPGLRLLSRREAREFEPELECTAALWSPTTGIIDGHALMLALLGDAERDGAILALHSPFMHGRITSGGFQLEVGGAESTTITTDLLVNASGLSAQRIGAALEGFPSASMPPSHYAKGNYYSLAGRVPFSRLIYPLPVIGGLGVHLTLDLAGQARFGPDVEWVTDVDYRVDPARADAFYAEVRRYWPSLENGSLQPAYAGIRPKIVGPGEAGADFLIQGAAIHGIPGLVNLFGIESPGLTSCLSIAEHVCDMIADRAA